MHGSARLDGLAYAAGLQGLTGPFAVATDARRKEVYWARYDSPRLRTTEPAVDRPADIAERVAGLPAVGAGAALYPEVFTDLRAAGAPVAPPRWPRWPPAKLAAGEEFLPPLPLYLRRPDAQVPAGYKAVLPR